MTKLLSRILRWRLRLALCLIPVAVWAQELPPCTVYLVDTLWSPCGQVITPGNGWAQASGVVDSLSMDFTYTSGTVAYFQIGIISYRRAPWCPSELRIATCRKECHP
jgi:hypothetical protein